MRKFFTLSMLSLFGIAAIYGCNKGTSSSFNMTAVVGTKPYSAISCIVDTVNFYNVDRFTIQGLAGSSTNPSFPYITILVFDPYFSTGSFNFDTTQLNSFATYLTSDTSGKLSGSGSVIITSVYPNVVGTFSFACTDGTKVTNGVFTAKYD